MAGRSARAPSHRGGGCRETCTAGIRSHKLIRSSNNMGAQSMEYYYHYFIVATVSGLSLVLYWNTLGADFAYDDSRAIKTNQDLLPSTPVSQLFYNDFWGTPLTHSGSHKSYRPLCVLSFRLNYALGGMDPWSYHFFNVLLHTMVCGLFTHFASIIFCRSILPTLTAGLLFAVHPIHTEAVAGVVGRADVGAAFFFLLALLSYMRYCKYRDKKQYLYLCLLLSAASMLTKEHGVTVLILCAVYDMLIIHRLHPKDILLVLSQKKYSFLREGLMYLGGTATTLLVLRVHLMGSKAPDFAPADNPASDNNSLLTRVLTFLYLPAFNFWLLMCPRWLSFDWSMESIPLLTHPADPRNIFSACFYLTVLHFVVHISRTLSSPKSCALCGSHSSCNCSSYYTWTNKLQLGKQYGRSKNYSCVINNNNNNSCTNGHHRSSYSNGVANGCPSNFNSAAYKTDCNYISAVHNHWNAVILAVSLLAFPFVPATNLFFYVGFVVAERVLYIPSMGFCLLVAVGLDRLYRRQDRLLKKRIVLGIILVLLLVMSVRTVRRNRDWWSEENLYRSGIPINPPKAYGNLANILSAQGKKSEAEWAYKKALSYRSNMADVHYNLGILQQEQGRYEEALISYKLAIQFRPRLAMAHLNLGLVLGILGRKEEAAEVYRHCAELDSSGLKDPKMHETTKISALFNLGRLYADDGSYKQAIQVYQEAVHKMPHHYQPQSLYNMMGEAFFKLKQFEEAERWYQQALRAKADHIPAHLTYAKLLSKWGRQREAEQWFLKAKVIAPNDSSVYQHYGQFLSESERHLEAAEVYLRAAELAPDEYEIIFNAANTLRQAGRNEDAEHYYQIAVKLRPQEVTSHINLGAMLHVNGKLSEAENAYLEALKLKPDDPITQNNLQKLRTLLNQKRTHRRR
ncbi:protein O-mannosyl-transferase TMTC2 isoform X2 [Parasteatoda tepidariorum]|uniref:protein O-mannosyl-transferase TMTC2 isoform X2 n=1 Tax=Parasteatoda tepidariorum TaxID=114398 RepID=UPI001C725C1C|nr:protein O-mannosyl-transferase TMTC2 isoform X2 [Parasteatoda tepidariorum]